MNAVQSFSNVTKKEIGFLLGLVPLQETQRQDRVAVTYFKKLYDFATTGKFPFQTLGRLAQTQELCKTIQIFSTARIGLKDLPLMIPVISSQNRASHAMIIVARGGDSLK